MYLPNTTTTKYVLHKHKPSLESEVSEQIINFLVRAHDRIFPTLSKYL